MTESNEDQQNDITDQEQGAADDEEMRFEVLKMYIKDLSFENPNPHEIFVDKWDPIIKVDMDNAVLSLPDNRYEVTLGMTVHISNAGKYAYLVEVKQAGLFKINGYSESDLSMILGSNCPSLLLPYLREVISNTTTQGGFPPYLIQHVDFQTLYLQHRAKLEEERAEQESAAAVVESEGETAH